jgi:hypothetical protein
MKTKKITLLIKTILFEIIAFALITQLLVYLLMNYFNSKADLSFGISLLYFYFIGFLLFSFGNIIVFMTKKKEYKFVSIILSLIILLIYWYDSLLIHPFRTLLIIISFVVVYTFGSLVLMRKILRNENK